MGRVRHVLVDERSQGRVTRHRDRPKLLEVAADMCYELRWISGGGRCYKKFA